MKGIIKKVVGSVIGWMISACIDDLKRQGKTKRGKAGKDSFLSKRYRKMSKAHGDTNTLWKELTLQQWTGWKAFARDWKHTHKRKPDGKPWKDKRCFNGFSAFRMVNFLLASIDMPYIKDAPTGISSPSMAGGLIVEYCRGRIYPTRQDTTSGLDKSSPYFDIKWEDPLYTVGKTFIRLWVRPPLKRKKGVRPTIQAVLPCGTGHHRLEGLLHKDKIIPFKKGIWLFYLDVVSEYGLKSAMSEVIMMKISE